MYQLLSLLILFSQTSTFVHLHFIWYGRRSLIYLNFYVFMMPPDFSFSLVLSGNDRYLPSSFFQMLSSKGNCKAILAVQGLCLKGAIITSDKQQQLCIISCLATDVEIEKRHTYTQGKVEENGILLFWCALCLYYLGLFLILCLMGYTHSATFQSL